MFDTAGGCKGGCGRGACSDVGGTVVTDALSQVVEQGMHNAKVVHHAVEVGSVHAIVAFVQVQGKDIEWEVLGSGGVGTWYESGHSQQAAVA